MTGKVQFNLSFIPAPLARGVDDVLHIWRHSYGFAQPCPRELELVVSCTTRSHLSQPSGPPLGSCMC